MRQIFLIFLQVLIDYEVNAIVLDGEVLMNFGYNRESVSVDLKGKNIDEISTLVFHNYNKLNVISLASNPLKEIDLHVFALAQNLKVLILAQTNLTRITNVYDVSLNNVELLDLSFTNILNLETNVIAAFPNLANFGLQFSYDLNPLVGNQLSSWTKLIDLHITTRNQTSLKCEKGQKS